MLPVNGCNYESTSTGPISFTAPCLFSGGSKHYIDKPAFQSPAPSSKHAPVEQPWHSRWLCITFWTRFSISISRSMMTPKRDPNRSQSQPHEGIPVGLCNTWRVFEYCASSLVATFCSTSLHFTLFILDRRLRTNFAVSYLSSLNTTAIAKTPSCPA